MKKLMAELIGTFALVFAGTGAIVINETSGGAVTHVGVALTFGLVVLAMIYSVGDISGAHLNPAVTLGLSPPVVSLSGALWAISPVNASAHFPRVAYCDFSFHRTSR